MGIDKEVCGGTNTKGCAEWKDLAANIVGILIGIL